MVMFAKVEELKCKGTRRGNSRNAETTETGMWYTATVPNEAAALFEE